LSNTRTDPGASRPKRFSKNRCVNALRLGRNSGVRCGRGARFRGAAFCPASPR